MTLPLLGNVNLFNNGTNLVALALLALAAIAAGLALKDRIGDVIWPGVAAAGVLIYHFLKLQYTLSEMRETMAKSLEGNPFAGMAQAALGSVQLQWGWIILAIGAGVLVYAGFSARKASGASTMTMEDTPAKAIVSASILLLIFAVGWDLIGKTDAAPRTPAIAGGALPSTTPTTGVSTETSEKPNEEEAAYIRHHLRLYDLEAKYFDSMLDGRVPGVDFKIKNNGKRTLNGVTVRVVFQDAQGNPIAEEEYNPVLVSEYNYTGDNAPLRPNYIWQNDPDRFYAAKQVPSEWKEGKATATITDIEFGPNS